MEARLGEILDLGKAESRERKAESPAAAIIEPVESDAVSANSAPVENPATANGLRPDSGNTGPGGEMPPPSESAAPPLPGDEAEAAFLAEARERGEDVATVTAALAAAEIEDEKGALPPLEALVQKLPAELRDTLDDLFRAKFVRVMRVRKKDLPA